jgi:hypothetical protein
MDKSLKSSPSKPWKIFGIIFFYWIMPVIIFIFDIFFLVFLSNQYEMPELNNVFLFALFRLGIIFVLFAPIIYYLAYIDLGFLKNYHHTEPMIAEDKSVQESTKTNVLVEQKLTKRDAIWGLASMFPFLCFEAFVLFDSLTTGVMRFTKGSPSTLWEDPFGYWLGVGTAGFFTLVFFYLCIEFIRDAFFRK